MLRGVRKERGKERGREGGRERERKKKGEGIREEKRARLV